MLLQAGIDFRFRVNYDKIIIKGLAIPPQEMPMLFQNTPALFGLFHLGFLAGITIFNILVYFWFRKLDSGKILRILQLMGLMMLLAEVWKQWFCFHYVFGESISLWFFPWQLCSMAMYCSFLLPFLREKYQNVVLAFLASFSFFAAIMALIVPSDMLRPQIPLACHGFLYHCFMISESIGAVLILKTRERVRFTPALILFLLMAAAAEVINVAGHHILHDIHIEPNMFYITPYYASTQVVFNSIANALGILPEILIYLLLIILMSYVFFLLLVRRRKKDSAPA